MHTQSNDSNKFALFFSFLIQSFFCLFMILPTYTYNCSVSSACSRTRFWITCNICCWNLKRKKSDEATSIWIQTELFSFVCSFFFSLFSNPSLYVRRCCKMVKNKTKENETFHIRTVPPLTYTYWVYVRFVLVISILFSSCNWTQPERERRQ